MSHFVVLVIGDNVEDQLAPYDESIDVPRYNRGVVTEEEKTRFKNFYIEKFPDEKDLSFEELYKLHGEDWNCSEWSKNSSTGVWYEWSTYNPKSKWDWWVEGGRWDGYLRTKKGKETNKAKKGELDLITPKEEARKEGLEVYDLAMKAFGGEIPTPEKSWEDLRNLPNGRELYHAQPEVQKMREVRDELSDKLGWFFDFDEMRCTREEYGQKCYNKELIPFAIVDEGEWVEKGKMGWFGVAHDEEDQEVWNQKVTELLEGLHDDVVITVVDCHI